MSLSSLVWAIIRAPSLLIMIFMLRHHFLSTFVSANPLQRILYPKYRPNPNPGTNYSIDFLWQLAAEQERFVVDTVKITHASLNPSMIVDPTNTSRIICIWRLVERDRHDKVGYNWLDRVTFNEIKLPDYVGTLPAPLS